MEEPFSVSTCSTGTTDRSRIRIHRHRDRSRCYGAEPVASMPLHSSDCREVLSEVLDQISRMLNIRDISASLILPSFSELRVNQIYNTTRTEWVPWLHSSHSVILGLASNVLATKAEVTGSHTPIISFFLYLPPHFLIRFVATATLISYRLKVLI